MARNRKARRNFINLKDQREFPRACDGYLWGTKKARKAKNKGKK